MWSLLTLSACQEPFGADRHDLVGFRVAAVSVPAVPPGEPLVPRVAVVVDGRPWSDRPVTLRWSWAARPEDVAALGPDSPAVAEGAAPALVAPRDGSVLALVAVDGDGRVERSFVAPPPPPADVGAVTGIGARALPLTVGEVTAEALQLDARRDLPPGDAVDAVGPGGFVRLEASVGADPLVRWMATAGTFFELDRATADWAAGELRLDGDEIDEDVPRTDLAPGWVTVLALALADGETAFDARDLAVGADDAPGVWVGGRFVPTPGGAVPVAVGQRLRGVLVADDDAPCGLALADAVAEPDDGVPPALPCGDGLPGPFDPDVLFDQRCARDDLIGAEVVVVPEGAP